MQIENLNPLLLKNLKTFWGYDGFRENQENIIKTIINGKDCIALLPTGEGKSLCYQLPALTLEGTCLVISPLLALMKDQVEHLKQIGIEAEFISSEMEDKDAEKIYQDAIDGFLKIIYISPERLKNENFLKKIVDINISFIAVDEAHCISEWGQDFRPSYQNIKKFRAEIKKVPMIALTATATVKVISEIHHKLGLQDPVIFKKSFKRDNLNIIVNEISDKYQKTLEFLSFSNHAGIIYVRTRKEAENLTHFLKRNNIQNVDFFHAGLSTIAKNERQNIWQKSKNNVLIATNAFGMGIDKDNVRFVIHFSPPTSIENYYQEIGRAGRDGKDSLCLMFWNKEETSNLEDIIKSKIPNKIEFINVISHLYSKFQISETEKINKTFEIELSEIQTKLKISLPKIKTILNFLTTQEIIYYNPNPSKSSIELKIKLEDLDQILKKEAYFIELLLRNLPGILSEKIYFDETYLAQKIETNPFLLKERLKELQQKNYLEYTNASKGSIKFLQERNSKSIEGKYWDIFKQIQKNKLQKWEEMKFFFADQQYCKMKLILSYFGEKNINNCGNCSVCNSKKNNYFGNVLADKIIHELKNSPATMEELCYKMNYPKKEKLLEHLILLLDSKKIKMLNYKTYTLY